MFVSAKRKQHVKVGLTATEPGTVYHFDHIPDLWIGACTFFLTFLKLAELYMCKRGYLPRPWLNVGTEELSFKICFYFQFLYSEI